MLDRPQATLLVLSRPNYAIPIHTYISIFSQVATPGKISDVLHHARRRFPQAFLFTALGSRPDQKARLHALELAMQVLR